MSKIEKIQVGPNHLRINCTLEVSDYKPEFEKSIRKYQSSANIKGFRKGKAPVSYVMIMMGSEILSDQICKKLDERLNAHIKEENYDLFTSVMPTPNQPYISGDVNNLQDFSYSIELLLTPEIEMPNFKEAYDKVEYITYKPTEEEIDGLLKHEISALKTNEDAEVFGEDCMAYIKITETDGEGAAKVDGFSQIVLVTHEFLRPDTFEIFKGVAANVEFGPFDMYGLDTKVGTEADFESLVLNLKEDQPRPNKLVLGKIFLMRKNSAPELTEDFLKEKFGEDVTDEVELRKACEQTLIDCYTVNHNFHFIESLASWSVANYPLDLPRDLVIEGAYIEYEYTKEQIAASSPDKIFFDKNFAYWFQRIARFAVESGSTEQDDETNDELPFKSFLELGSINVSLDRKQNALTERLKRIKTDQEKSLIQNEYSIYGVSSKLVKIIEPKRNVVLGVENFLEKLREQQFSFLNQVEEQTETEALEELSAEV